MRTPMIPGPSTITLDQESFKALASEVRVDILKRLDERRQTVTDLSTLLSLSKPTLLEHLEKLQGAGLVKRVDEGRKWIYYELSQKGKKLLHPERVAIVLALGSAIGLAAIGVFLVIYDAIYLASLQSVRGNPVVAPGAPALYQTLRPEGSLLGYAILFFVAAATAIGAGLVLRWWGKRRRTRFFLKLAKA